MGTSLGPTLSNIFMGFIERKVISKYKVIYFKYADDCFTLGKNKKEIDELFSAFNKTHASITFTSQKENNDELAFLDVLVKRHKNQFLTSLNRKQFYWKRFNLSFIL